jgi:hypothetical protein
MIVRELILAERDGWTRDEALIETMARGWQGVKAEWLSKRKRPMNGSGPTGWWKEAGFESEVEARNDGCTPHTYKQFENGKRSKS